MKKRKILRKKSLSSRDIARSIAQAAYDVQATDIVTLDLRKHASFTDYFVIASGRSDRQVQAIAQRIEENLSKKQIKPLGIEGKNPGHWILIDCGSVVAHIFYEELRDFYALEKLWADAPRIQFRLK